MSRRISRFGAAFALLGLVALPLAHVVAAQALPQVSVTATDSTATEPGSNTGAFTVSRTGDTTAAVTVGYGVGGTATAGTDYMTLSGSVALGVGESTATITVTPLDDLLDESRETVVLTLLAGSGYTVGSPSVATVTIRDNDGTDEGAARGRRAGTARPGWGWGDENHEHYGPPGHRCTVADPCADDDSISEASDRHPGKPDEDELHESRGRERAANHGSQNRGRGRGHR